MCGCCSSRSFISKEERIELLEDYRASLEKEAKGVEEEIQRVKKAS